MTKENNSLLETKDKQMANRKLAEYCAGLRKKYTLNRQVLLIQPPQFMLDVFNLQVARNKGCYAYPPTGLQCLAKSLAGRGLKIDILDLNYQLLKRVIEDEAFSYLNWLQILDAYLMKNNPSVIGITCISVYTDVFKDTHPLTCLLKHLMSKDKYILIAGGPIATNEYENYLKKDLCHFIIEGEGEERINFLFDHLYDDSKNQESTAGIYFKFENNVEETKGKHSHVSLKGNLIETYKTLPIEDYHNVGSLNPFSRMSGRERIFTGIQLTRGCRANCKFCGVIEFMGRGLRQYPLADLWEEIYYLVEERGVRHFEVLDDDFLGYHTTQETAIKLLEELGRLNKKYAISWAAGNGLIAVSLTKEILELMRDSGCLGFRIGIESGNEEMLRRMRKPTSLPLLRKTSKMLDNFPEFFVGGNYIIGLFQEETFGQMLDTFKFSCEMNLDWAAFTTFQFTSKARALRENFPCPENQATDFIPAKDTSNRQIAQSEEIISGPQVFAMAKETVPARDQIKQVWFAFNLVANYINNKNLLPEGRPQKFISWVEAVHTVYPGNPYMPLFAGLAYLLLGKNDAARLQLKKAKENVEASGYWINRFKEFDLIDLISDFPQSAKEAYAVLEHKRKRYAQWLA